MPTTLFPPAIRLLHCAMAAAILGLVASDWSMAELRAILPRLLPGVVVSQVAGATEHRWFDSPEADVLPRMIARTWQRRSAFALQEGSGAA